MNSNLTVIKPPVLLPSLTPGKVSENYFRLLTKIYTIHSRKLLRAIEFHLVHGYTRIEACEKTGATQSYLSTKLKELNRVHRTITELYQNCYPAPVCTCRNQIQ